MDKYQVKIESIQEDKDIDWIETNNYNRILHTMFTDEKKMIEILTSARKIKRLCKIATILILLENDNLRIDKRKGKRIYTMDERVNFSDFSIDGITFHVGRSVDFYNTKRLPCEKSAGIKQKLLSVLDKEVNRENATIRMLIAKDMVVGSLKEHHTISNSIAFVRRLKLLGYIPIFRPWEYYITSEINDFGGLLPKLIN